MDIATEVRSDTRRLPREPIDLTRVVRGSMMLVGLAIGYLLAVVTIAMLERY